MDKQKLTEFFNVLDGWLLSRVYQPLISDSNARSPRALCEFFSIGCIFAIFACIHAAFIEHLTDVLFFKGLLLIAVSATYFLMGQQAASADGRKMLRTSAIGRATRATFVVASTVAGARIGWGMILGNLGVTWFLDLAVQLLFMSAIYAASCDSAPPPNLRRRSAPGSSCRRLGSALRTLPNLLAGQPASRSELQWARLSTFKASAAHGERDGFSRLSIARS